MKYQEYINQKKEFYSDIIQFIERENENTEFYFETIVNSINTQNIQENPDELKLLINILVDISDKHSRSHNLINKIERIIIFLKEDIKQTFTNLELFNFTKINKLILLFLIKEKIIAIDSNIIKLLRQNDYLIYFYPEIKNMLDSEELEKIEKKIKNYDSSLFENFEDIRKSGENESYICELIRTDSVEEFIIYMNKKSISPSSQINYSPFETNSFLQQFHEISLIDYAAFFGSVQIFQYLKLNNVELKPSLWLFAIHSNSAEMIHQLEENLVQPEKILFLLKESIKCHHNDIANYINNSMLNEASIELNTSIIKCIFHHYNFEFFSNEINMNLVFFYLFQYNYKTLIKLYLKQKVPEINNDRIINTYIF